MWLGSAASSSWRWASTPSFTRPGSIPISWTQSDRHLVQTDGEGLIGRIGDHPGVVVLGDGVGRVHPVEGLVGAAVGVDGNTSVGLDHDQTHGLGQVRSQASVVVDGATGNQQAHQR